MENLVEVSHKNTSKTTTLYTHTQRENGVKIMTKQATVYGKKMCPNCDQAKRLLTVNNYEIVYKSIDDTNIFDEFMQKTQEQLGRPAQSIPQIWINDNYVGGFPELNGFLKRSHS